MKRTVLLAIGNFWQWFESDSDRTLLDQELTVLLESAQSPAGFEFYVDCEALLTWASRLKTNPYCFPLRYDFLSSTIKTKVIRSCVNTLHFPHAQEILSSDRMSFQRSMDTIREITGIQEATIHPDECREDDFDSLISMLPNDFVLSVENMDKRKGSFQRLSELEVFLKRNPKVSWTFDICHWLENYTDQSDSELFSILRKFRERLSKVHFSAPTSQAKFYREEDSSDCHFLAVDSGWNLLEILSNFDISVPFVLEGTVPRGRFDALRREVSLL